MKNRRSLIMGVLAVALALTLIGATLVTGGAESNGLSDAEISAIVNTVTDAGKISSPFIDVVNQVRDSVVGVNNYATTTYYGYGYGYGRGQYQTQEALRGTGSGVVITDMGHVLTNYHVVEGATRLTVTTGVDDEEHEAQLMGYDADLDIAVLLVDGLNLPAVPLGDSDKIQVGEWAIVIGNPIGEKYARSVTMGIVSGLDREVTDSSVDRYGRMTSVTNTMIQTDAAINSGNSGGGMFNILGQLQGIPARYAASASSSFFFSSGRDVDNIGLCIPINTAKPLIEKVLKEYTGSAAAPSQNSARNQSGASVQEPLFGKPRFGVTITTILNDSNAVLPQGAFVRSVDDNSPAAAAGILPGDIIVEIDGTIISNNQAMTDKLNGYKEGDSVAVKVYRAEGLAEQALSTSIDFSKIGDGEYLDMTVQLKVLDQVEHVL